MKKLYRKGTVHPSPPVISDHLSFLPAAILTLTLALSPQDRQVLAYLISSNNTFSPAPNPRRSTAANNNNNHHHQKVVVEGDHPPLFHCSCFRCYMSYWARWDTSPNHQLIHEIIDAYEDWLAQNSNPTKTSTKVKKKDKRTKGKAAESKRPDSVASPPVPSDAQLEPVGETCNSGRCSDWGGEEDEVGEDGAVVESEEKGYFRRFASFIGERIWGAWGQ